MANEFKSSEAFGYIARSQSTGRVDVTILAFVDSWRPGLPDKAIEHVRAP